MVAAARRQSPWPADWIRFACAVCGYIRETLHYEDAEACKLCGAAVIGELFTVGDRRVIKPTRAQVLEALAHVGVAAGWGDAAGDRK